MKPGRRGLCRTVALSLVAIAVTACAAFNAYVTPKHVGPGTDYPCGATGVVCGDSPPATNCCPQNYICQPNACEYAGNPDTLQDVPGTTFGARRPRTLARMSEPDGGAR